MSILRSKVGRRMALLATLVIAAVAVAATSGSAHRVAVRSVMTPDTMQSPFLAEKTDAVPNPDGLVRFTCQLTVPAGCYGPDQMRAAYDVQPLLDAGYTGAGRTIVIIDAYGSKTINSDSALFNSVWGLPATNLSVYTPFGVDPTTPANASGWSGETTLDVEWAHAIAPAANIALVIAKSNDDADILDATQYAVDNNLGDTVSQSFGEAEQCMEPALVQRQQAIFRSAVAKGMTLFASSGDQGAGLPLCDNDAVYFKAASTPASDPNVTGVGGTTLHADGRTGAYQSESTWNESAIVGDAAAGGGGVSVLYQRPIFQLVGAPWRGAAFMRLVPDVSYNAAIFNGVIVVWTRPGTSVAAYRFGGTSAGSPQWAAIAAITDQLGGHRIGNINQALYTIPKLNGSAFHDIADGSNNSVPNGLGGTITGFTAVPGYDMATGLGSPVASVLAPLLARLAGN